MDHIDRFDYLLQLIFPASVSGLFALDILSRNEKAVLTPQNKGFKTLSKYWPDLDGSKIFFIGRSYAYLDLSPLFACDRQKKEIGNRWTISKARSLFLKKQKSGLFHIGLILFWIGIFITSVSGLLEFFNINREVHSSVVAGLLEQKAWQVNL